MHSIPELGHHHSPISVEMRLRVAIATPASWFLLLLLRITHSMSLPCTYIPGCSTNRPNISGLLADGEVVEA